MTLKTIHDSLITESTYMWLFNPRSRLYWPCLEFVPPMFTRHLVFRIILPPCSKFFSEKIPWQGGAGWLQRGAASPPFPRPGSESSLKPPGNVTFLSLLSLSSGRSLLLHALNPSFTFIGPSILEESVTFLPSSHCFARPPLSSSLTFGSEKRNSWSVRTRR